MMTKLVSIPQRRDSHGAGSRRTPWAAKAAWCAAVALLLLCFSAKSSAQVQHVRAVDWSKYAGMTGIRPGDHFGQTLADVLQNESRYMYSWVDSQHSVEAELVPWNGIPCYYPRFADYGYERSVRPLAHIAYSTAAMIRTDIYSPEVGELSATDAFHRTELAIRGVAFTHRVNKSSGYRWGQGLSHSQSWQAAYWAAQAAEAAWMLWDDVSSETRLAVSKMVEYEANSLIATAVPYWKDRDGNTNYPGDTKAEENSWNSHLLAVAQAMMPSHPNAATWRWKASEYQVSAYSRQSDVHNTELVDGRQVKAWLGGYNAFNDGVVVNHDFIHPDYLASDGNSRLGSIVDVSLAGQYVPPSMVFNADVLYGALTELSFVPGANPYGTGTMDPPGGTIYRRAGTGASAVYEAEMYYPQGNDWTSKVSDGYLNVDLAAEYLGLDAGKDFDAMGWAEARVEYFQDLQNRPGHDGNIYQSGDWYVEYRSTDAVIFHSLALAWMQWWLMEHGQVSPVSDHWGTVPVVLGDTDKDGDVDADDARTMAENWGKSVALGNVTLGDFNRDGIVGAADAAILAANWGTGASEETTVPEPSTLAVLVGLVACIYICRVATRDHMPG